MVRKNKGNGGVKALHTQIGDYGFPYQFLIALMTYFPIQAVYLYKITSCLFDFLLAYCCARFVCFLRGERFGSFFCVVYSVILFLPTVILNSSIWGQCDAMYVTFVVLALYSLYGETTPYGISNIKNWIR